jgi:hypothetical protein
MVIAGKQRPVSWFPVGIALHKPALNIIEQVSRGWNNAA